VNPEFGGGIALGFGVFDNLRIKIGASWIISTSQTVGGSYNVAFREDVAEQYKAALYKDVNLAYSGISVSGGLEFGL
jgi:hypothetical protein